SRCSGTTAAGASTGVTLGYMDGGPPSAESGRHLWGARTEHSHAEGADHGKEPLAPAQRPAAPRAARPDARRRDSGTRRRGGDGSAGGGAGKGERPRRSFLAAHRQGTPQKPPAIAPKATNGMP